jgi:hypothetical protein
MMTAESLKVYLSYSQQDKHFAEKLMRELLAQQPNIVLFSPSTIVVGESWIEQIKQQMENANLFVIVFSKNSKDNPWLGYELGYALSQREKKSVRVVPIVVGDAEGVSLNLLWDTSFLTYKDDQSIDKLVRDILSAPQNVTRFETSNEFENEFIYGKRRALDALHRAQSTERFSKERRFVGIFILALTLAVVGSFVWAPIYGGEVAKNIFVLLGSMVTAILSGAVGFYFGRGSSSEPHGGEREGHQTKNGGSNE